MSNQLQITGGAKVRALEGVITGTSGVLSSVPYGGANGVATLDSGGKVPVSQLPSSVVTYLGTWNAATNTPYLVNGTGDAGDLYICNVAGTANFGAGPITFAVGDWVLYGSGTWQKSNGQNGTVTSVAASITGNSIGITGSPITTAGTLAFAFAGTNLQYVNGAGDLTTFPSLTGYVTSVTGTAPVVSSGGTTPAISMAAATTLVDGYLSATNFVTFNNKQNAITLTTTGTSGAATLIGATLNIPNYGSGLTGYVPYTGATQDVDLGAFKLNAQSLHAKGTGGLGHLGLKHQSASATASANEVSLFADSLGDLSWLNGNLYLSKFITSNNTANRTYTFPNASGTVALLTSLSFVAGSGAYNSTTGVITIPTNNTQITNGANYITLGSLSATSPIFYNSTTGVISSQAASATLEGYVTTGTQTIAGAKTFSSGVTSSSFYAQGNGTQGGYLYLKQGTTPYTTLTGSNSITADSTKYIFYSDAGSSNAKIALFELGSLTNNTNRTYTLPDASGTVALTSNLSSYVPYTGATTSVNLGLYDLTALYLAVSQDGDSVGGYINFKQCSSVNNGSIGNTNIFAKNSTQFGINYMQSSGLNKTAIFDASSITTGNVRTFTFPDASGTLALTSSLSGYLPLTGGTLTGALSGTSATFSSSVTASQGIFTLATSGGSIGSVKNLIALNTNEAIGNWSGINFSYSNSGTNFGYIGTIITTDVNNSLADLVFGVKASNTVTAVTEYMRIKGGGNVGIGTSSPTQKLEVYAGNYDGVKINASDAPSLFFYLQGGSQKNWGIATTNLAAGDFGIYQSNSNAGNPITAGTARLYINSSGVITISSLGTGAVTATSGVLSTTSDMNLKIEDGYIDNALEKVLKLTPRYFLWKEESGLPTDLRQLGFYAQEVNEALGEEVANTPKDKNQSWGIYDRGIIAMLTKAMQEQQALITSLQSRLDNAGL